MIREVSKDMFIRDAVGNLRLPKYEDEESEDNEKITYEDSQARLLSLQLQLDKFIKEDEVLGSFKFSNVKTLQ